MYVGPTLEIRSCPPSDNEHWPDVRIKRLAHRQLLNVVLTIENKWFADRRVMYVGPTLEICSWPTVG